MMARQPNRKLEIVRRLKAAHMLGVERRRPSVATAAPKRLKRGPDARFERGKSGAWIEQTMPRARMMIPLVALLASLAAGGGCTSLEKTDTMTGLPQVFGWGCVTNIPVCKGTVCRVRSPGISLRVGRYAPGLTVGWHETLLFLPEERESIRRPNLRPVAIRTRDYGVSISPFCFMLGEISEFGVFAPPPGSSVVQDIRFSPSSLATTIIIEETKP